MTQNKYVLNKKATISIERNTFSPEHVPFHATTPVKVVLDRRSIGAVFVCTFARRKHRDNRAAIPVLLCVAHMICKQRICRTICCYINIFSGTLVE